MESDNVHTYIQIKYATYFLIEFLHLNNLFNRCIDIVPLVPTNCKGDQVLWFPFQILKNPIMY